MNKKILFFVLMGILIFPLQVMGVVPETFSAILRNIGDVVQAIGGAMIIIGFVVAGILYLLAAGKPEKIETAKKALIASVIGAVIVILSYATSGIVQIIQEILNITGTEI